MNHKAEKDIHQGNNKTENLKIKRMTKTISQDHSTSDHLQYSSVVANLKIPNKPHADIVKKKGQDLLSKMKPDPPQNQCPSREQDQCTQVDSLTQGPAAPAIQEEV